MYREDEAARAARANALISEIAELERQRVARAELDQRLDLARHELATLQVTAAPAAEPMPGLLAHALVFAVAASASFLGYRLMF